jgi:hypothetical protein
MATGAVVRRRGLLRASALAFSVVTLACASAGPGAGGGEPEAGPASETGARDPDAVAEQSSSEAAGMVPAGYGTLRQDAITVTLRSGDVQVKVTPLDEATIRLLAPDTYNRLHSLRESRLPQVGADVRTPELFLVSFFSYRPDQSFQPEHVQLTYQSRLLRPGAISPVTNGWGRQRLGQQETQMAVYAFPGPIDYEQSFTVRYEQEESAEWQKIVPVLEAERARVLTRGGVP